MPQAAEEDLRGSHPACGSRSTTMEIQDTLSEVLPAELGRQQREELARRHVDGAEAWLRRIVHHQLSQRYGADSCGEKV